MLFCHIVSEFEIKIEFVKLFHLIWCYCMSLELQYIICDFFFRHFVSE